MNKILKQFLNEAQLETDEALVTLTDTLNDLMDDGGTKLTSETLVEAIKSVEDKVGTGGAKELMEAVKERL